MRAHSKQFSWDLVFLFLFPADLAALCWQVPGGLQSFWQIFCIALCGWMTSHSLCSPPTPGGKVALFSVSSFASPWLAVGGPPGASLAAVCWGQPRVSCLCCCGQTYVVVLLHSFPSPFLPLSEKFIRSWRVAPWGQAGTSYTGACAGLTGGSVTAVVSMVAFSLLPHLSVCGSAFCACGPSVCSPDVVPLAQRHWSARPGEPQRDADKFSPS